MAYEERSEAERLADERQREVEALSKGMTLRKLRLLDESELVRRYDLLMDPETGYGALGPGDYLDEIRRREAELQGKRLDELTRGLLGLTFVIVLQTAAIIALEVESHHPGQGLSAAIVTLALIETYKGAIRAPASYRVGARAGPPRCVERTTWSCLGPWPYV